MTGASDCLQLAALAPPLTLVAVELGVDFEQAEPMMARTEIAATARRRCRAYMRVSFRSTMRPKGTGVDTVSGGPVNRKVAPGGLLVSGHPTAPTALVCRPPG